MGKAISINPSTGEQIAVYARLNQQDTETKVKAAKNAFEDWKKLSYAERAKYFVRLANVLEDKKEIYAKLATQEMGKTIGQSRKEIEKCIWVCNFYAENAASFLKNESIETDAHRSFVTFSPLGVVLAVMPWNFPFYQVIRFAVPTLMAGNTGILKHASNVQGCALALEDAFDSAGFAKGIFTNLNIGSEMIEEVIGNEHVRAVTLTGSGPAGKSVASIAGKHLKKSVLELGGSDAYIVLEDADIDEASELALFGRLQNNGQTCIAAKRFIVVEAVYDTFLQRFTEKMKGAKMGNPMDEDSYYGPMAKVELRDELHEQVETTIDQGGKLVSGGYIPDGPGAYYPATILTELKPGMVGFDNELFGPVAAISTAADEREAIVLANASKFGLGAGVITKDVKRGEKIALQLEAGNTFVNKLVVSDPRLPFGGIKTSGYGRELSSYGIREFTNIKTVWVEEEVE